MFLIQIALLHLNQLFKTVSRRSSTFSYLSPYLHTSWWKELFLKCLTPAFSHFVIPFHDSSPWFYGTVSKVQSASTPCQKWSQDLAGFHFAAAVVLLVSLSFKYLSEINFVARKAKYLSLAWLFTDTSLVYPLRWRSKTSLLILYISWHFQNLGTNMLLLCPAQTFSWFLLLTTVLFTQWWLRTKNYKRGQRICFPAF